MVWAYKVRIRYTQNRYTITEAWCKHYKGPTVPLYVRAYLRSRFIEFLAWGICCMVHKVKLIPWKTFETARLLLLLLLLWSLFSQDQIFYVILIKDFMLVMHCFRISELHIPVNNIGTTYWLPNTKMQYTHYVSNWLSCSLLCALGDVLGAYGKYIWVEDIPVNFHSANPA